MAGMAAGTMTCAKGPAASAEVACRFEVDGGRILDAGIYSKRDREERTHDYYEDDGLLASTPARE